MSAADLALLRAYEPVVRFTEGELFLPTAAGPYVARCGLWAGPPAVPGDRRRRGAAQLVAPGGLTLDRLALLGREHADRSLQLRFVTGPPDRAALRAWRREERPRLRGTRPVSGGRAAHPDDRLGAAGVAAAARPACWPTGARAGPRRGVLLAVNLRELRRG